MLVVSYDISDTKKRARFSKMLRMNSAIRLQYSVYEKNNTTRVIDNLLIKIEEFSKQFSGEDSVIIFDVSSVRLKNMGMLFIVMWI
mgnify:FL=1